MSTSHLFSSGRIGSLELSNRIFVTAMGVSLSNVDGTVGDRLIAYHAEQAVGGAALIISGVTGVAWPTGAVQPNQTAISDDKFLPGLKRLTDAVHANGSRIAAQLHHGGIVAGYSGDAFGEELWVSSIPSPQPGDFVDYFLPEELAAFAGGPPPRLRVIDHADIARAVAQFGAAAGRAKAAGFDAIEIHGGHGYLISSFISPRGNSRTDEYGGSLENRMRFPLEVIAAVRAAVGPGFPVWIKLDSREIGREGGITLADAIASARMVEAAGVDAITVTAYHNTSIGKLHSASNIPHEPETNLAAASAIKAAVKIPVIASGRIEPEAADRHIDEGRYDFLAMGRKLLADPQLPRKLAEGRARDVRPCIYCYTCVSTAYVREPLRCAVNPETGFECERPSQAPAGAKRYVVIGGGPGGIEAACRLDAAGHNVVLLERSDKLGGTLRFAGLAYPPNQRLLEWLIRRIKQSGVDVRLSSEATIETLRDLAPDAVVVATGAVRGMPPIPGGELPHVLSGDDFRAMLSGQLTAEVKRKTGLATRTALRLGALTGLTGSIDTVRAASKAWMPLGRRIVIVGGELVGVELAEFLFEREREVTVIEPAPRLGKGLTLVRRMRLLSELRDHGVDLHGGVREIAITPEAVTFVDSEGKAQSLPADHVIVAMGATGDTSLAARLTTEGFRVETVGDCLGVTYIEGAIRGGADAARRLTAG